MFLGIEKESRKEMVSTCWECKSKWKYRRSISSSCSWRDWFSQWESRTDYFSRRNWSILVSIYLFGYVYRSGNFETFENRKRSVFNKGWSMEVWRFNQKTSWSKRWRHASCNKTIPKFFVLISECKEQLCFWKNVR